MPENKENLENWAMIPECQNITSTECDLSLLKLDYLSYYNVCVRVEVRNESLPAAFLTFCPYLRGMTFFLVCLFLHVILL